MKNSLFKKYYFDYQQKCIFLNEYQVCLIKEEAIICTYGNIMKIKKSGLNNKHRKVQ